jgi:DNA-binding PucR family transcriptional regulator
MEVPIATGDERLGSVLLLTGSPEPAAADYLHLAAVASLTDVAIEDAKDEVEQNLRGSFLEDLRRGAELDRDEVVRRAGRLGCDLSGGAVALCAELTTDRPRHVVATIASELPGALAQHMDGRVYALLPGDGDAARRLATRLQRHGIVGASSYYADPADLARAVQEAELVLDVLRQSGGDGGLAGEDIGSGTYRLLFRVLASHPEEVQAFYEDTVGSVVRYDAQYGTDLIGTLEAYLEQDCNMNATAAAIYAHRHTVAYRLERVRDLSGLDPLRSQDRERLGLGLKAYRIIAPRLPR